MLELQRVTRRFGGHAAVLDVSLRVEAGSLTGLIGPNGAGKSTLFNLVAGALAPSAGRILLDGGRIDGEPPHRVLARGVARTFQIPRPFPAMTVLENVMLASRGQRGERFWANWTQAALVATAAAFTVVMLLLVFALSTPFAAGTGRVSPRLIEEATETMRASPAAADLGSCP